MIRTLRASFLGRELREKLLLVAFVGLGAVIWFSSFTKRASLSWRDARATTRALTVQQDWINRQPAIDAAARQAASKFDAAKTYNQPRLFSEVRGLISEAGLKNPSVANQTPITNGQFTVNSLSVTIAGIDDWAALRKFYWLLQQKSPYIGIDQFVIQGPTRGSTQHTLVVKVSSVEIAPR